MKSITTEYMQDQFAEELDWSFDLWVNGTLSDIGLRREIILAQRYYPFFDEFYAWLSYWGDSLMPDLGG